MRSVLFVGCLGIAMFSSGQTTSPPNSQEIPRPPEPSVRITTRVVLVDTIVTDANSRPVTNLSPSDFTILEDGKPQKISFFSYQSPAERPSVSAAKPLRSDVFTNRPEYHNPEGPLVLLLLDGLNTPVGQQIYVRQQMLKYLSNLKLSGPGTAILALGNDLSLLQDFTTNPEQLRAAVRNYLGGRTFLDVESPKIDVPVDVQGAQGLNASVSIAAPGADPADSIAPPTTSANSFAILAESLTHFEKRITNEEQDIRTTATLAALRDIGRAVSGYPGRKTLI